MKIAGVSNAARLKRMTSASDPHVLTDLSSVEPSEGDGRTPRSRAAPAGLRLCVAPRPAELTLRAFPFLKSGHTDRATNFHSQDSLPSAQLPPNPAALGAFRNVQSRFQRACWKR